MSLEWFFGALLLSLVGSIHCAAMCGPLFIANSMLFQSPKAYIFPHILHLSGKTFSYILLGFLFGWIGGKLMLIIYQQWLLIATGTIMLIFTFFENPLRRIFNRAFANSTTQKLGHKSNFILGLINGFIPCGLSYTAALASMGTGSMLSGVLFMLIFGIGTIPILSFTAFSRWIIRWRSKVKYSIIKKTIIATLSLLFILKGLNLGIPYLSPKVFIEKEKVSVDCCTPP